MIIKMYCISFYFVPLPKCTMQLLKLLILSNTMHKFLLKIEILLCRICTFTRSLLTTLLRSLFILCMRHCILSLWPWNVPARRWQAILPRVLILRSLSTLVNFYSNFIRLRRQIVVILDGDHVWITATFIHPRRKTSHRRAALYPRLITFEINYI